MPALALLGNDEGRMDLTFAQNLLWALSITFFGLFVAVPLRKQTVMLHGSAFLVPFLYVASIPEARFDWDWII